MWVFQTDPVGVKPFPLQIEWRSVGWLLKRRVREWTNDKSSMHFIH